MSVKGSSLIHVGGSVLLDRLQSAGPGNPNLNPTKVYELGNTEAIGQVLDIPDLSFPMQSFDASAEMESMLCGTDFATDAAGTAYDFTKAIPVDVVSQFKRPRTDTNPNNVEIGVAAPYLTLESVAYQFGVSANAQQTATFKGDSLFYTPGSVFIDTAVGTGATGQTIALAHAAYPYNGDVLNGVRYALAVTTSKGRRLNFGADYTEAATGAGAAKTVTVTLNTAIAADETVRVTYSSDTVATYPKASLAAPSATRPAAIRGPQIRVYVGGAELTNAWTGVQQFQGTWQVSLDRDLEFGNSQVVTQDYDVPTCSGSIDFKPRNATEFYQRVAQAAGASSQTEVVGALQQGVLPLDVVLHSPIDGSALKTISVPDARFTLPGFTGQVQQKLTATLSWDSDSGSMVVYKGQRAGAGA